MEEKVKSLLKNEGKFAFINNIDEEILDNSKIIIQFDNTSFSWGDVQNKIYNNSDILISITDKINIYIKNNEKIIISELESLIFKISKSLNFRFIGKLQSTFSYQYYWYELFN